jgi:hypothetical protein
MRSSWYRFLPLLVALGGCATAPRAASPAVAAGIPAAWLSVPQATRIGAISLDAERKVTVAPEPAPARLSDGPIRIQSDPIRPRLMNGDQPLTDQFAAIDSFDYSESRQEVIFSAKRDDNFDIGLAAADGSKVNWIPSDPADEVLVEWAPRGSKVSYVIRAGGGDVVRTLHIPSAMQFSVPFPMATIHALAWDPQAEQYAVAYSTPDASDRVEVLKYEGTGRRTVIASAATLDADLEPFAAGAILLRPRDIRYEEKLPLAVWIGDFAWSDARAALAKNARVAMIVTRRPPDETFWKAVAELPWIDVRRTFLVAPQPVAATPAASPLAPVIITAGRAVAGGQYRRDGNVVSVPPAVIQSFAAGFIADQLKRTTPTNGSSR